MREINKFLHNQNFSSPIFTINTNNFIHLVNIQKNEIITNKILEYYIIKLKNIVVVEMELKLYKLVNYSVFHRLLQLRQIYRYFILSIS